jgi:hypothetical protein
MQDTTYLLRLSKQEKKALFEAARLHNTTAAEYARQIIRGKVLPDMPCLVSKQQVEERA